MLGRPDMHGSKSLLHKVSGRDGKRGLLCRDCESKSLLHKVSGRDETPATVLAKSGLNPFFIRSPAATFGGREVIEISRV